MYIHYFAKIKNFKCGMSSLIDSVFKMYEGLESSKVIVEKHIDKLRQDSAPVDYIIENIRDTGIPISQREFNQNRTGSYERLNLSGIDINIESYYKPLNFRGIYADKTTHISIQGKQFDFTDAIFNGTPFGCEVSDSNFTNAKFLNVLFYDADIRDSIANNVKILGGSLGRCGSLFMFNTEVVGLKTNEDEINQLDTENIQVSATTPWSYFRCHNATIDYQNKDKELLHKVDVKLPDAKLETLLLIENNSREELSKKKTALIFSENYQIGNNPKDVIMKECLYDISKKDRERFLYAIETDKQIDFTKEKLELRFARPILKVDTD